MYIPLLIFLPALFGQAQGPSRAPKAPQAVFLPRDSPHLYRLYFYFHTTIDAIVQQHKTGKNPAEMQKINRETALNFGLPSEQGLPMLRSVSNAYASELRAVDEEQKVHANSRAKLELAPIPAQMQAFEARRQAIVNRGISALRTQSSSADWTGFQNFLNGTYRTSNSIVSIGR